MTTQVLKHLLADRKDALPLLAAEIERLDREMESADGDEFESLHADHWAIREIANGIEAIEEDLFAAKLRIAQSALALDVGMECSVAGSARELFRSLVADADRWEAESDIAGTKAAA